MTKRTLAMLLALLALLLTGCGNAEPKTTEAEIGSQSTDDAAALPDTTEQKPVADAPMMVLSGYDSAALSSGIEDELLVERLPSAPPQ